MTTQYATFAGLPSGLTLTAKLFTEATPDTVAYTSDSTSNRTNAKDEYVFTFGETAAISGNYTLKVFSGTNIIGTGKRTFAGTDTETATETGVTAVLDSEYAAAKTAASQTSVDAVAAAVAAALLTLNVQVEAY